MGCPLLFLKCDYKDEIMKNYVQDGKILTVIAPYAVTSGAGVQIGAALFGVACFAAAQDEELEISTERVYGIKKKTTDVMTAGAKLYWDNTNKELTVTVGTNLYAGLCVKDAGNGATTVNIKINV